MICPNILAYIAQHPEKLIDVSDDTLMLLVTKCPEPMRLLEFALRDNDLFNTVGFDIISNLYDNPFLCTVGRLLVDFILSDGHGQFDEDEIGQMCPSRPVLLGYHALAFGRYDKKYHGDYPVDMYGKIVTEHCEEWWQSYVLAHPEHEEHVYMNYCGAVRR